MIQIDWQSRTPIYNQLINSVIKLKTLGVLKPHDQLPSVRSLASELGVNPNTVQKAYQLLETQGVIYSVSGKGSFISDNHGASDQIIQTCEKRVKDVILEAAQIGVNKESILKIVNDIYKDRSEQFD